MKIEHDFNQRTRAALSVRIRQTEKEKETLGLEPTCLWLEGTASTITLQLSEFKQIFLEQVSSTVEWLATVGAFESGRQPQLKRTLTFNTDIRCPLAPRNVQTLSELRSKVCPFPQKVWTLPLATWSRLCKLKIDHDYNQRTRSALSVRKRRKQMEKEMLGLEPTCLCMEGNALTVTLKLIEFKQIFVEQITSTVE